MIKLTTFALIAGLATSAAHATTLTFDERGFEGGTKVTSFSKGGISGQVSATGGSGDAMIYDTTKLTGNDRDLFGPFYRSFNPKRGARNAGNVLIISEDGDSSDPDDNANGGTITFTFNQLVDFSGFRVFDDVTNFVVRSNKGDESAPISLDFDNQWARVDVDFKGVSSLTFDFGNASGAIDALRFEVAAVPVPASLPLLLAGFGALGFASRRKARKA